MRKLVNESLSAFLSLQKMAKDHHQGGSGTSLTSGQLVNVSRQYRSVIRDCQEQLDTAFSDEESKLLSELLYKLELIWQLAEVLFIQRGASKMAIF